MTTGRANDMRIEVSQEGAFFVATCAEVDIASQGETMDEALNNLREALELYFEEEL